MLLTAFLLQAQNPNTPGDALNRGVYITPSSLPSRLATFHELSGLRMASAEKARLTIVGTLADSNGSRAAQIEIQAPGYLSYREDNSRAVTFDGTGFKTKSGGTTANDDAIAESLLAHFPDTWLLQMASGGSLRRLGSNFRPDGTKTLNYTGPYWTVFAFAPAQRQGLAEGKALQQQLFIAIDNRTNLIAEVRTVTNSGPNQQQVIQTQFTNWVKSSDQWFPGTITRLENGKQVLKFQQQQAVTGLAEATTKFVP